MQKKRIHGLFFFPFDLFKHSSFSSSCPFLPSYIPFHFSISLLLSLSLSFSFLLLYLLHSTNSLSISSCPFSLLVLILINISFKKSFNPLPLTAPPLEENCWRHDCKRCEHDVIDRSNHGCTENIQGLEREGEGGREREREEERERNDGRVGVGTRGNGRQGCRVKEG